MSHHPENALCRLTLEVVCPTNAVVPNLVQFQLLTRHELGTAKALHSIDIDIQQAQYLQTIGDGWAFPLQRFMNETELLESLHMKTVSDANGERHLLSV